MQVGMLTRARRNCARHRCALLSRVGQRLVHCRARRCSAVGRGAIGIHGAASASWTGGAGRASAVHSGLPAVNLAVGARGAISCFTLTAAAVFWAAAPGCIFAAFACRAAAVNVTLVPVQNAVSAADTRSGHSGVKAAKLRSDGGPALAIVPLAAGMLRARSAVISREKAAVLAEIFACDGTRVSRRSASPACAVAIFSARSAVSAGFAYRAAVAFGQ